MRFVVALEDFEAHKGFEVKKGCIYPIDENGNVYVKTFICQEHAENFKKFKVVGGDD